MGQKFSLNAFTPDVIVFIQKYFPNYNIIKLLANGMLYKTVLITKDKDNTPLILKIFLKNDYDERDKELFLQEYQNMLTIQHKIFNKQINNICPIINMENNFRVGMIFRQYVEYNLKERIYLMPYLQNIEKIWITFQMLYALNDLKEMKIIHGDLKPENILLTDDEKIKICDFGSSKIINSFPINNKTQDSIESDEITIVKSTPYTVSRFYRAPELFFGKCDYNSKIDIFSIGLIIGELFTLETLFIGINEGMQILEYINVLGIPDLNYLNQFNMPKNFKQYLKNYKIKKVYSLEEILNKNNIYNKKDIDEACDLLYNMLKWDYDERFSAEECLRHKFFSDADIG